MVAKKRRYSSTAVRFPKSDDLNPDKQTISERFSTRRRTRRRTGEEEKTMKKERINILIACEESQRECIAFRERGFNAFSCDIQKCGGGHPEWHIMGDVTLLLDGCSSFVTMDGKRHVLKKWHCIIAHPPCTYLCKVSSVQMIKHGVINQLRYEKMLLAKEFFFKCLEAKADFVAVENPRPMARAGLPKPNAQVSPHNFGNKYSKATYYWLKNLPPLIFGVQLSVKPKSFCNSSSGKYRSRTFPEIAQAIAEQWGSFILEDLNKKR